MARFNARRHGVPLDRADHGKNRLVEATTVSPPRATLLRQNVVSCRLGRGATMMDRPEWVAAHPTTKEVFVTLTNNRQPAASPKPGRRPASRCRQPAGQEPLRPHHPLEGSRPATRPRRRFACRLFPCWPATPRVASDKWLHGSVQGRRLRLPRRAMVRSHRPHPLDSDGCLYQPTSPRRDSSRCWATT